MSIVRASRVERPTRLETLRTSMRALAVVLALLALAAGAAFFFGYVGDGPGVVIADTVYDTDADGEADLRARQIGDRAVVWTWDRDQDGAPEITAYDVALDDDGNMARTGAITAWDLGSDGVLDEGTVPDELQALLASEDYLRAEANAAPGRVQLVDITTRGLVAEMKTSYDDWRLSGFRMPIVGASLPDQDNLLPGARRAYRFGIHQGFDMYDGHIGVPTGYGAPVVAAKDGMVVRADTGYEEMSASVYDAAIARSRDAGTTPPEELDMLRGRQVWIDHGHGVLTRYAHLSGIANGIEEGTRVQAGDIVGYVGNSGMEAATRGNRGGAHLHFELRIDDRYFGEALASDEIRRRAREIFGL